MSRPRASAATLTDIATALDKLQATVTALTASHHTHRLTPTWLVGLAEIAAYIRRSPASVTRYRRSMGFPAYRMGRHTVSSPSLIDRWLVTVAEQKQQARNGREARSPHAHPQGAATDAPLDRQPNAPG